MATNLHSDGQLRRVGKFSSAPEAEMARLALEDEGIRSRVEQAELVTNLFPLVGAFGGVYLAVREVDAQAALATLRRLRDEAAREADDDEPWDDLPVSGEGGYADEDEDPLAPPVNPELVRAYRTAVIGLLVFPPLLNFYSLWIIFRQKLWQEENWRLPVTIIVNVLGAVVGGMILKAFGWPWII